MRRITSDTYAAVIICTLACVALWQTAGLNEMSATFPRTIGVIMLSLGVIYFVMSVLRPGRKQPFAQIDKSRVIPLVLGMAVYVLLIWAVGFLPASLTFIAFFVWLLQGKARSRGKRMMRAFIFSLVVGISFYVLFHYVFLVPLPKGLLFGG